MADVTAADQAAAMTSGRAVAMIEGRDRLSQTLCPHGERLGWACRQCIIAEIDRAYCAGVQARVTALEGALAKKIAHKGTCTYLDLEACNCGAIDKALTPGAGGTA
jgi:hypothetical protein